MKFVKYFEARLVLKPHGSLTLKPKWISDPCIYYFHLHTLDKLPFFFKYLLFKVIFVLWCTRTANEMHPVFYCVDFFLASCCVTKIGFPQECDSLAFAADLTRSIKVWKILPLFPPLLLGGRVQNVCKWHERTLFWVHVWINYSQVTLKLENLEGTISHSIVSASRTLRKHLRTASPQEKSCSWRWCRKSAKNTDEIAEYLTVYRSEKKNVCNWVFEAPNEKKAKEKERIVTDS